MTIVTYRPELREAFERLNLAWLEEHALLEPADLEYLREPESHILQGGGEVFFAIEDGEVLGTCAAIRRADGSVELAKLAVAPAARGRGLGRALSERVVETARGWGARRVVLTSHTALAAAIRLYESMGFVHVPMPADVRYATANVAMELDLSR